MPLATIVVSPSEFGLQPGQATTMRWSHAGLSKVPADRGTHCMIDPMRTLPDRLHLNESAGTGVL
jgi:hypothetical protein